MATADCLKDQVRAVAARLGFQLFGIAPAERLEDDLERLWNWIVRGNAAGMTYLDRSSERRADPAAQFQGARSVIMLGTSYAQIAPNLAAISGRPEGRVARFALGRDYHRVLRPRLEEIARFLNESASAESLSFVDTGPLLERAFARRAGLGFIGKNNCLIHPEHGSWFVLGALVTTADLPPDQPLESRCGDCRLCLDACPTGALTAPHQLDARRCLSYVNVETSAPLAPEQMEGMRDFLFGCDACQEVCPFNRAPLPCRDRDLQPPAPREHSFGEAPADPDLPGADSLLGGWNAALDRILRIPSNRAFQRAFSGALARPGRKGLLRNAAIVAGNIGREDLEPILERLARSEAEAATLRTAAAWALKRLGGGAQK